ncbi:biofilm development regulator YmgB/AriR family protein [Kluyvera cryocrescens]|uniref:biofilm development regulator YmgB/AriR family protein n=1 Tax=Kluyvera cryocrescens TaxID=580 RepID=UPI000D94BA57|nr:biofilm development regulator YmgB/AriR family protein [Kluyvera cryocrescens]SQC35122.1 Probable two-component-system connector protein AriR [Kluyvera cryocrescens]HEP1897115.1 two-component-system connector protein AriR [Kluyvera cryocrescens]HEP1899062.1 two-component-system connector protein AriR [Kluyvera cryocrescens]
MLHTNQFSSTLPDKALAGFFTKSGDSLAEEARLLGQIAYDLMNTGVPLTNKNLILCLLKALDGTNDVTQADVIRNTLEIVVGHTSDDLSLYDDE